MSVVILPGRGAAGTDEPHSDTAGDDVRLMRAARTDPARFAPLYERYFPRIYAYCLRRLGSADDAEDVTSQVFIRALGSLPEYRGGLVAAWLFRIARNAVLNHHRDRRLHLSLDGSDLDLADDAPPPGERLEQAEERQAIRALVATLPDDQQDLLALKLDAALTSEEIGEAVGKSAGAVRVELHRIIQKLRARYENAEPRSAQ